MSEERERPWTGRVSWLIWIFLGVLVILLISAFSRAWSLHEALREKEALLEPMLSIEHEKETTLAAELTYVQSDAYVAEWARGYARMHQPGETLVIPLVPTPTPTPTLLPTPQPTPEPGPFWQRWLESLRGE